MGSRSDALSIYSGASGPVSADYSVASAGRLRLLGVCASAFYQWQKRPVSQRALQKELLVARICELFEQSKGRYGSPRIHRDVQALGIRCSQKRVARLMREQNLVVRKPRKFVATTDSAHAFPVAQNLLNPKYQGNAVTGLNQVWAGDITYIPTAQGWLYQGWLYEGWLYEGWLYEGWLYEGWLYEGWLYEGWLYQGWLYEGWLYEGWLYQGWLYVAVVLDLKSRKVIGVIVWSMRDSLEQTLVHEALQMAIDQRFSAQGSDALLFHSDRGSQYAAHDYQELLQERGIMCSMSRRGDCWDNAPVESFFATLKKRRCIAKTI